MQLFYSYLCALFLGCKLFNNFNANSQILYLYRYYFIVSGSCCYRNKSKITDRSGCFCELW